MDITKLPLDLLREASWNANKMDNSMLSRLRTSIERYGLVENLVVRPDAAAYYEVLSGNQRLEVLRSMGVDPVPCVVVNLNDAEARLLSQALNRIQGEDDLGLKAELVREIIDELPQEEVLSLLPETVDSLQSLCSLGQETMATYLQNWQQAQAARLKHLQFQLTPDQLEMVVDVLDRLMPLARESQGDSPNARGTALYLLCLGYLEREGMPA